MNRKQYLITLISFGVVSVALIVTNSFFEYLSWFIVVLIISAGYFYIRYKITGPLQMFATRFNMMVDYDLDVEGALKMAKENFDNAPTNAVKSLFMIYLGMAYYYNTRYRDAINTFNQIDLNKVNPLYHVLIFAFSAYAAYEEGDDEIFNLSLGRMEEVKNRINKRYLAFASNYYDILSAMKNLELDPENYREVIERNFSREDGYISTRLVYNYRMALYYKTVGNTDEMDKCLAKVIANGKNHHTAIQAKTLFQNTCNVEDFVFDNPSGKVSDVEIVEEPKQLEHLEEVEIVEEEVKKIESIDPEEKE